MKKRPISIVLIAGIFFLEPLGALAYAAYVNKLALWGSQSIFTHLLWSDWVILSLFPLVGLGIYLVRKWGWYLFLSFSTLLILYNLYVYKFLNPNYSAAAVIFFIIITSITAAFFLRKNIYAPFFNPRIRWWEIAQRYRVPLQTVVLTKAGPIRCKTLDISKTGCFVNQQEGLSVGNQIMIEFRCKSIKINCLGKVVNYRKSPQQGMSGHGIAFQAMTKEMKGKIEQLLWYFESIGLEDRKDPAPAADVTAGIL